jgi:hypothetical protein
MLKPQPLRELARDIRNGMPAERIAGIIEAMADLVERDETAPAEDSSPRRLSSLQAHVVTIEAQHRALVHGLLDACSQVVRSSSMHTSIRVFAGMLANAIEGAQTTEAAPPTSASSSIMPGDMVRCGGEGDALFRVVEVDATSAFLERVRTTPHGWETLSKLSKIAEVRT